MYSAFWVILATIFFFFALKILSQTWPSADYNTPTVWKNVNLSKLSRLRAAVVCLLNKRFTAKYHLSQFRGHLVWKVGGAQLHKPLCKQQHYNTYGTIKSFNVSPDRPPERRGWRRQRLPARRACCWLAGGSDSPEAGGEEEAGTTDPGPRSPPGRPSSRDKEGGRRRLPAAAPLWGRGHREALEREREGEGRIMIIIFSPQLISEQRLCWKSEK